MLSNGKSSYGVDRQFNDFGITARGSFYQCGINWFQQLCFDRFDE
jgi:hypothetical protein